MAKPTTYVTPSETVTAARALLARVVTDSDHVQADAAEARGDEPAADLARSLPAFTGSAHLDLKIGDEHVPPMLRGERPWFLLVDAYSNDDHNAVCGHDCFGVDVSAITAEVFGSDIVEWCTVRYAPRHVQQALAMLLLAEIRRRRAVSVVWRAYRERGYLVSQHRSAA